MLKLASILVISIAITIGNAVDGLAVAAAQQSCSGSPPSLTIRESTEIVGTQSQPCRIKIPKPDGVCQVRLDFLNFDVGTANQDGNCPDDSVTLKSDNLPNGLKLCGTASGQHLYLHYGQLDTITINTNLVSPGSGFNIAVTLIECGAGLALQAPDGCTQYYTAPSAEVRSFNYPVQQLSSQLYTVCVSRDYGEVIQWQTCSAPNNAFSISGMAGPLPGTIESRGDFCKTDYVFIPPGDKICGTYFNSTIVTGLAPFFVVVNFDATEIPLPPGVVDPMTGCPPGFICSSPIGPCGPGDVCSAPPWFLDLLDVGNVGFCFKYTINFALRNAGLRSDADSDSDDNVQI